MLRLAYVILAHHKPDQLGRLVRRLDDGTCAFYVHVDVKSDLGPFRQNLATAPGRNRVRFVQRREDGKWGRFGLTQGILNALREVATSTGPFDYALLLSGVDYPLAHPRAVHEKLAQHRASRIYLLHQPVDAERTPHVVERLARYYVPLHSRRTLIYPYPETSWRRLAANRLIQSAGLLPLPRTVPLGHAPHFGLHWACLPAFAVRYILKFAEKHPEYARFFRHTLLPEEFFFSTMLANSPDWVIRENLVNESLTYTQWDRGDELYPVPIQESEFNNLIRSGKLFARKFDAARTPRLLDALDAHIDGAGRVPVRAGFEGVSG